MQPITFKIEKDGDQWHTWSPELPGCHTHGKTVKEALENLKDAIQVYLETMLERIRQTTFLNLVWSIVIRL